MWLLDVIYIYISFSYNITVLSQLGKGKCVINYKRTSLNKQETCKIFFKGLVCLKIRFTFCILFLDQPRRFYTEEKDWERVMNVSERETDRERERRCSGIMCICFDSLCYTPHKFVSQSEQR